MIDGRLVWHSISRYLPSPLDVLEHPWIQWCVLLPQGHRRTRVDDVVAVGHQARARRSACVTGLSHMEWFRRPDGSSPSPRSGARPPGAQFMSLMSFAHDVDLYAAWARLAVEERVRPAGAPLRRRRARTCGRRARAASSPPSMASTTSATRPRGGRRRAPAPPRRRPTGTYEGDGYVIVRDPETAAVERGARRADLDDPPGVWLMDVVFLGPGYPGEMPLFTRGLAEVGARVIGVGDQHVDALPAVGPAGARRLHPDRFVGR